jgi:thiol-disulfide isomerase/thioredoxin
MMYKFSVSVLILFLSFCAASVSAQSGRVIQGAPTNSTTADASKGLTAKEMFEEANVYAKTKFAEYESKKIPYTDNLYNVTIKEQKQLAARYAATINKRGDIAGEDFYYLGMLNWLSDGDENATESFRKFLLTENPAIEKLQTARSIIIVVAARQKKFDEAEKTLDEYLKTEPVKLTERYRMESELAKSYQHEKNLTKAAPHAVEAFSASKLLLKESTSRASALDELLDAGMTLFEIYRDSSKSKEAEGTLEDLRKNAVALGSSSLYFRAIDEHIKYLIKTGRKPKALQMYSEALAQVDKDFAAKPLREDATRRLKRREKHYRLLGETAPELTAIDRWLPGQPQTLASLRGKVVLIDFWATWCAPCIAAFPSLIELHQTFKKDGLEILGVTKYEGVAAGQRVDNAAEIEFLQRFRKENRLPYEFVVTKDITNQITYGASAIPTTVLIDRKGIVRYIEAGNSELREEEIRQEIEKLLAEKQ